MRFGHRQFPRHIAQGFSGYGVIRFQTGRGAGLLIFVFFPANRFISPLHFPPKNALTSRHADPIGHARP
jgi:hypothetical protein